MLLSQLTYFEVLARERHFGRAAASCFVTTSTLSEAIRKLEKEVGSPLVNRSHSAFQGLTHEGELVLTYAQRITADQRHLEEDLAAVRGELSATVRVGVIPAGTGWAARLLDRIAEAHPRVRFDLRAGLRSEEIVEGLRAHELDAGIIHTTPEGVRGQRVTTVGSVRFTVVGVPALFRERFGSVPASLSGAELSTSAVALLSPGMLAREEFNRAMSEFDVQVTPVLDSDAVAALLSSAEEGRWFAVVPEWAPLSDRLCAVPLEDPEVRLSIAVSRLDTRPVASVARAVDAAAAEVAAEVAAEMAAGGASS